SFTPRRSRRRMAVSAGCLAVGLVLTACGGSGTASSDQAGSSSGDTETSASSEPLNIILQPAANGLPVLVAQSQGFFTKHGITVAKIDHQATGQLYPALIAQRQYDIADLTPPTVLTAVAQNLDIVAIANEFNVSKSFPLEYLMVPNDSPIKSLTD